MGRALRIRVVGDFDQEKLPHWATEAALFHAAARLEVSIDLQWIDTDRIQRYGAAECLRDADGIWGAPGSPFVSAEGMLDAIAFARTNDRPYLGTCAGYQYALIEFTRNVLGLADADTAENGSASANIVITPVSCSLPARGPGAPKMSGGDLVYPVEDGVLARLCGPEPLRGEYFCDFETNPAYLSRWCDAGLAIAARDGRGDMRALALPDRRFFLATLFQPQRSSRFDAPHPIVLGFLRASTTTAARA